MGGFALRRRRRLARVALIGALAIGLLALDPASVPATQEPADRDVVPSAENAALRGAQEIPALRTRDSKTYALPGAGKRVSEIGEMLHYKGADGTWQDVDLDFRASGANFVMDRHELAVTVAPNAIVAKERSTGKGISWTLPARPAVQGRTATFRGQYGLDWTYTTRKTGIKLATTIASSVGARTYTFPYSLVGGARPLAPDLDGRLTSDRFEVPRALAYGADGVVYEAGAWSVAGATASFAFDDAALPAAAFPYELDPTLIFAVAGQYDDQYLQRCGSTYPPTGTISNVNSTILLAARSLSGGQYCIRNLLAAWPTAQLPDTAIVTSSYLRLSVRAGANANARKLTGEWYAASNWPLSTNDYAQDAAGGASPAVGWTIPTAAGSYDFMLYNLTNVNRTGYTGMRVHINGSTPTGQNYVETNTYETAQAQTEPRIVVTWEMPPNAPSGTIIPAASAFVNTTTPKFEATFTDPDGGKGQLKVDVYPYDLSTVLVTNGTSPLVNSGSRTAWYIAPGILSDGNSYKWRVRNYDQTGHYSTTFSPSSGHHVFTVDTTLPVAPTVSSTQYPSGAWSQSHQTSGTFTFSSTSSDAVGFLYGLDEPTPTSYVAVGSPTTVTLAPDEGPHTLYVRTKDRAGNLSAVTTYAFKVGDGAVTTPAAGDRTQKWLTLASEAKTSFTGVTYEFRRSGNDTWATIPTANVKDANDDPLQQWPVALVSGVAPTLRWDVASTTAGADGPVQVRASFTDGATPPVTGASLGVETKLDQKGLGGDYASSSVGPGSVNLITGNFSLSASDASVSSYGSDLSVGRTHNSRFPSSSPDGMFGPGWDASISVEAAGSDYVKLVENTADEFVVVTTEDGTQIGFAKSGTAYEAEEGYDDLTLTSPAAGTFELKDQEGNVTVFTKPTGASDYVPTEVKQPGTSQTTSFSYETVSGVTRPTRMLAPVPSGVTCPAYPTALVQGCRALTFDYATSTTATGTDPSGWGTYTGRVNTVSFTAWDPDLGTPAMRTVDVAQYSYDSNGRLRAVWDPRISPALKTTYSYDAAGHVTTITPPGEEAWTIAYAAVGADANTGRLRSVSRPSLLASPSPAAAETTVVYNVPLSGTGAPYAMAASDVAAWAQTDVPTDATAIFPPNQIPDALPSMPSSYERATVHYVNVDGRAVNVASPGGYVTTTEYNGDGNVRRELSASNRAAALAYGSTAAEHAARAVELDTQKVYSADGVDLVDEYGPLHSVMLDSGETVLARAHTHTVYADHLPTSVTSGAFVPGSTADVDVRETRTAYDTTLRKPTEVTTDYGTGKLNLVSKTLYDSVTGLVTETRMPGGPSGGTAHSTKTLYYVSGTHPTDSACSNKAHWANLVCKVTPAAQPGTSGLPNLPVTTFTYTMANQPKTTTETVGTSTRTTTIGYDAAGRAETETVTSGVGTSVPVATSAYSTSTGRLLTTSVTENSVTSTITRAYDTLGRLTSYTDADSNQSTVTYDLLGRPVTTDDGKGTQTRSYDQGSERRGLPGQLVDSAAGTFTATYNADGALQTKTYPNDLRATYTYDATGSATALVYEKIANCSSDCTWLSFEVAESVTGQWRTHASDLSSQTFTYDGAGRLSTVADTPAAAGCTTRAYSFDADSNRTSLLERTPGEDGACPTSGGVTTNRSYDAADRLLGTGYTYDDFGRITAVPAADAGGTALSNAYYTNDLVRSITKGSTTRTWTLDPGRRFRSWSDNGGTASVNHYAGDSDSPAWVQETATTWTRNIGGIDGDLAGIYSSAAAATELQLVNLHGDVVATAATNSTVTALLATFESDEFGKPRTTSPRYGWLGGKQRATDALSGVVLMGVRLYVPTLGRFLQVDPVDGGSLNKYEYAGQDPINGFDLDGKIGWKRWFKKWGGRIGTALAVASMFTPAGWISTAVMVGAFAFNQASILSSGGSFTGIMMATAFNVVGSFVPGSKVLRDAGRLGRSYRWLARGLSGGLIAGNAMMTSWLPGQYRTPRNLLRGRNRRYGRWD